MMQSFTVFTFVSIVIVSQRNHCYIPTSIGPVEEIYTLLEWTLQYAEINLIRLSWVKTLLKNQPASMTRNKIASILWQIQCFIFNGSCINQVDLPQLGKKTNINKEVFSFFIF